MADSINARARLQASAATLSLDAKRTGFEGGTDSWYPYYAGYSPGFARNVLSMLALPPGATVLDPWNGAGTTTLVADELGYRAIGFDINPVAALVANARLVRLRDVAHAAGLMESVARAADGASFRISRQDALRPWLGSRHIRAYRSIERAVLANLATDAAGHTLQPVREALPPLAAFLLLALMRAAKRFAGVKRGSNPTWTIPSGTPTIDRGNLAEEWSRTVQTMLSDLSSSESGPASSSVQIADSRALPLPDSSVDFVLTSPPYCTRIDYVVNTAFELAAMQISSESDAYDGLRRLTMGTPLARVTDVCMQAESWPDDIKSLLERIQRHPSKASHSYYYKTYLQYFTDTRRSLSELARVLRAGGGAALVVQSSYYKEIAVDLPRLYLSLAREEGMVGDIVAETTVRRSLSQINARSSKHLSEKSYSEAVVCLEKAA